MESKQTAVAWLVEQLKERGYAGEFPPHLLFDQAKEMEREQIIDAVNSQRQLGWDEKGEQYYTETYGK
jgi:hypothetical protein